jgi:hypothetical protein
LHSLEADLFSSAVIGFANTEEVLENNQVLILAIKPI